MKNKSKKICDKIPNVDERFDLWVQMQKLAYHILEISNEWWDDDEELRQHAYPYDDSYPDIPY